MSPLRQLEIGLPEFLKGPAVTIRLMNDRQPVRLEHLAELFGEDAARAPRLPPRRLIYGSICSSGRHVGALEPLGAEHRPSVAAEQVLRDAGGGEEVVARGLELLAQSWQIDVE
jgi:hypothetical protein